MEEKGGEVEYIYIDHTAQANTINFIKVSDTYMFSYQTSGKIQIETNFDLSIHTDDQLQSYIQMHIAQFQCISDVMKEKRGEVECVCIENTAQEKTINRQ